ncbi:hypothetical protein A3759_15215 [Thalassolituus sp. HI0120]|nr:hypothetical protein A3759_15215 [Thalassolituus sp. HI0120]
MTEYIFPEIDTRYWKLDDKEWVKNRKQQWKVIEPMFKDGAHKSKQGIGIIKKYYMKGEMPDFKSLKDWDDFDGHLDLFCFLWLHPSDDKGTLETLRDEYIDYPLVLENDLSRGLNIFLSYATLYSSYSYKDSEVNKVLNTNGNNVFYYNLLFGHRVEEKKNTMVLLIQIFL